MELRSCTQKIIEDFFGGPTLPILAETLFRGLSCRRSWSQLSIFVVSHAS